jgi:hypothetical protein
MKSDILLTLIKEVVKNEVKQQVKEEISRMIKSGKIVLNNNQNSAKSIKPLSEMYKPSTDKTAQQQLKKQKDFSKNPMLNEILNQTEPFSAAQRVDAGMGTSSILDAIRPKVSMEDDWETMDYRTTEVPPINQTTVTDNEAVDALTKALSRDYRELVKRF